MTPLASTVTARAAAIDLGQPFLRQDQRHRRRAQDAVGAETAEARRPRGLGNVVDQRDAQRIQQPVRRVGRRVRRDDRAFHEAGEQRVAIESAAIHADAGGEDLFPRRERELRERALQDDQRVGVVGDGARAASERGGDELAAEAVTDQVQAHLLGTQRLQRLDDRVQAGRSDDPGALLHRPERERVGRS